MIVQHIDGLLAERIHALARHRHCSTNDVMLQALRRGLGLSVAHQFSESQRDPETVAMLEGHWEAAEQGVFQEALNALVHTRATQFAPERIRYDEPAAGEE
ncbi:hypothetical protein PY254_01715 [Rhodanobacter sp. AS-Z3]|uniref:hypothetical protein n=1 Tax=Rhodanobacter sp. AS-Z3 TaxID=3031330 RepID=UPI00247892E9|nr:hypothetical protein [Rhodanobacter sp. AS-Z3]WEN16791.1 hypothetical protein PY254_01715 [Rhodanobacter sp. AS-Z3]